jgi:hypothetical protein
VEAFRRKGWSEAKIERWRGERTRSRKPEHAQDSTLDLMTWLGFLRQVAAEGRTSYLGLMVRWSSDAIGAEIDHPISDVDEVFLDSMKRDVLYRLG